MSQFEQFPQLVLVPRTHLGAHQPSYKMDIVWKRKNGQDVKLTSTKTYNAWSYSPLTLKGPEMALVEAVERFILIISL